MIQYNHHPSLGNVIFFSLVSHMLLDLAIVLLMVNINMPRASNILYSVMYSVSQLLQLFCSVNNISLYFVEFYASLKKCVPVARELRLQWSSRKRPLE